MEVFTGLRSPGEAGFRKHSLRKHAPRPDPDSGGEARTRGQQQGNGHSEEAGQAPGGLAQDHGVLDKASLGRSGRGFLGEEA